MQTKTIEIIPALAVKLDPVTERDRYLIARAGYGIEPVAQSRAVILIRLNGGNGHSDPYDWRDRTHQAAHIHVTEHWDDLPTGCVIDVEHILGEKPEPSESEQFARIA